MPVGGALDRALEKHRHALSSCRRCADGPSEVRPIVALARAPKAMLVGQAPGRVEAHGGVPFAGRAGRTLFRWLATTGVNEATFRERVYIAAITRCFPGPATSGRGDRVPAPRERELCASWLAAELRMIQPPLIIPVGRLAIDRFFGAVALADVIGAEHTLAHEGGDSLVIPLPHPSGASSWIHQSGHRVLLTRALGLLGVRMRQLGIVSSTTSRSVA